MTSYPVLDGPRILPASGGAPRQLVILSHGYGANGDDLIGLAPYWQAALPDAAFVAPNAPERCPGAPGGYQWWGISTLSYEERLSGTRRAALVLDAFIDAELDRYGLTESQLALVGFSQGTMMSLHVGLRRARPVAGIVGYSGMLIAPELLEAEMRSRPPVLLVHGDADQVLPVSAFYQAEGALSALGFDLQAHVVPGLGHGIDPNGLQWGGEFLARVLGAA